MAEGHARIGNEHYRTQIVVGRHEFVCDEPATLGGADAGPAPYDMLVAGLGACTAITLRMYADRKGWPLQSVDVGIKMTRVDGQMQVQRTLTIVGLDDEQKARMADIAERTPVTLTLKAGMPITTTLA